jgi:serine/threonine protein kinase
VPRPARAVPLLLDRPGGHSGGPRQPAGAPPEIEGFEVLGEIGRGGMGVVYKARQVKLDRLVALKLIHAGARV